MPSPSRCVPAPAARPARRRPPLPPVTVYGAADSPRSPSVGRPGRGAAEGGAGGAWPRRRRAWSDSAPLLLPPTARCAAAAGAGRRPPSWAGGLRAAAARGRTEPLGRHAVSSSLPAADTTRLYPRRGRRPEAAPGPGAWIAALRVRPPLARRRHACLPAAPSRRPPYVCPRARRHRDGGSATARAAAL